MEIGTGIAMCGIWLSVGMIVRSDNVSNAGAWIYLILAIILTCEIL